MMKTKVRHLSIGLDKKSLEQDGTFVGYGSVFGNKDSYGDVVVKGAFTNTLVTKMPKMLWQHDASMPIGVFKNAYEDEHGLRLEGKLAIDSTAGRDAYALMKAGAVDSLSIGYYLKKFEIDKEQKTLFIKEVDLLEVSLVTFPANEEAQVESVKHEFNGGKLNKEIAKLKKKLSELEHKISKTTEGSVEELAVDEGMAETKTHESAEDEGADDKALLKAMEELLTTFRTSKLV